MAGEVDLVVAVVEIEDIAAQHGRPAGEHLFAHRLPCLPVVLLGLLSVVDLKDSPRSDSSDKVRPKIDTEGVMSADSR